MSQITNDVSPVNDNERRQLVSSSSSPIQVSHQPVINNESNSSQTSQSFETFLRLPQSVDDNRGNVTQLESAYNCYVNRANNDLTNGVNMNYFFEMMKNEFNRLSSFTIRSSSQWPVSFISPQDLANAGFFYLNDDRVQCAFCRGIVSGWEAGDRPLAEHARHFPRCPFIMEDDVGNIPIVYDPIRGPKITRGHDVCGNYSPSLFRDPVLSSISAVPNGHDMVLPLDMREYGVQPHRGPKNPSFSSIDARKRSFVVNSWNTKIPVSVDGLAESGFFSIGMMDYVKCFYCDGGLCNWEKGDEPWVEHAKWFPDCEFVRLNKSQTFIDECRTLADTENVSNSDQNNTTQITTTATNTTNTTSNQTTNTTNTDEESNDSLGVRAVNEWLGSDIVRQLIELKTYPIDVIKATLNRRWHEEKQPFQSFAQLYDAITQSRIASVDQSREHETVTAMESEDESYFSASQSSSLSQQSASSTESPSPPNSQSPTSSQCSLTLSIPESALSELSSLSDSPKSDDNRLLCKICLDREIGVVFLPCGHQLACTQCAPCCADCPICRQTIRGTVRTFFS